MKIPWKKGINKDSWFIFFCDGTIIDVWRWANWDSWNSMVILGDYPRKQKIFNDLKNPLEASRAALKYLKESEWQP